MDRNNDLNRAVPGKGDIIPYGFGRYRTGSYEESTIHKRDGGSNRNGLDSSVRSARHGNSIDIRTKRVPDRIPVRNSRTMLHPNNHSERIFRTITTNHQYKMKNMRKRLRSNSNSVPFDSSKDTYLNGMETHARLLYEDGSADKQLFDEPNGSDDMASRSKPKSGEAAIGTGVSILKPKNGVIHTIRSIVSMNHRNSNGHHTIERELDHLKKPPTRRPTKRPRPTVTPTKTPREKRPTRRPKPTAAPTRKPSPPTYKPTRRPTPKPSVKPTRRPTSKPSKVPTTVPPTSLPTKVPTERPSTEPTVVPTDRPSEPPSAIPSHDPTTLPTVLPSTPPSATPSTRPTSEPSVLPSVRPSHSPSVLPSVLPSHPPTALPSVVPSHQPTANPTTAPIVTISLSLYFDPVVSASELTRDDRYDLTDEPATSGLHRVLNGILCRDTYFFLIVEEDSVLGNACRVTRRHAHKHARRLQPSDVTSSSETLDPFTILLVHPGYAEIVDRSIAATIPSGDTNTNVTLQWISVSYQYTILRIGEAYRQPIKPKEGSFDVDVDVDSVPLLTIPEQISADATRALNERIRDGTVLRQLQFGEQKPVLPTVVSICVPGTERSTFLPFALQNANLPSINVTSLSLVTNIPHVSSIISTRYLGIALLFATLVFSIWLFGTAQRHKNRRESKCRSLRPKPPTASVKQQLSVPKKSLVPCVPVTDNNRVEISVVKFPTNQQLVPLEQIPRLSKNITNKGLYA